MAQSSNRAQALNIPQRKVKVRQSGNRFISHTTQLRPLLQYIQLGEFCNRCGKDPFEMLLQSSLIDKRCKSGTKSLNRSKGPIDVGIDMLDWGSIKIPKFWRKRWIGIRATTPTPQVLAGLPPCNSFNRVVWLRHFGWIRQSGVLEIAWLPDCLIAFPLTRQE